ncbi:MAG: hypothetical protein AAGA60_24180 [Cyanobacteria bacterium P01_E01_bin.42]
MDKKKVENTYLQQVLQEQEEIDRQLSKSRARLPEMSASRARKAQSRRGNLAQDRGRTVDYRIVGYLWWKSVIVPPNVYVIHTRRGKATPIHIGMGISFSFNPFKDAFLIVPSAVQTILINAKCICQERQGVLVQAYVQWIIDDIQTAYQKLDFSDPDDPMGIVNVQLREQAEAAIKDKVSTLSIDEVLSDKQPIIEELTYRLRMVAEGNHESDNSQGLGLKIVTVQIKEAIVSSAQLWENLQAPFRAERDKFARLAELENQSEISDRERQDLLERETSDLNVQSQLEQLQAAKEQEKYDREYAEKNRRQQLEENAARQKITEENTTERVRNEAQLELALQQTERSKRARLAELENQGEISDRERQDRLESETSELDARGQLEQLQAEKEQEKYNREYAETNRRQQLQENAARQQITEENNTARVRNEAKLELALQELELEQRRLAAEIEKVQQQMQLDEIQAQQIRGTVSTELEIEQMRHLEKVAAAERELGLEQQRRNIENDISESNLQTKLIAQLPEIAEKLPAPQEQKTTIITTDGQDTAANSLLSFLASTLSLGQSFLQKQNKQEESE